MVCALYCTADLISLLSFYLILRYVFKENPHKKLWRPVMCGVLSATVSITGYLLLPSRTEYAYDILDFAATIIGLLSILILFKRPRFWRGFAVLFIYYATVDTLWSFIASFFNVNIVYEAGFNLLMTAAVSVAVFKYSDHKDLNVVAGALREVPVWLLVSLFLFELTNYYQEFGTSELAYKILYVTSSCLIFLSILYLVFRIFRLVYTQNDIMRQLNEQLIQADEQKKSDETLRRFRHDIKNHTIVLNAMLEQGNYEGARSYFKSFSYELIASLSQFTTGNSVVDSLLNVRAASAKEQGTELTFIGKIPEQGIEPKDMCVCFGNLLDNAIEACTALPEVIERKIEISSVTKNNILLISFTNPIDPSKSFSGWGLPKSTKKDVKAHGIGLKNVRDTVKKYNGSLHLTVDQGQFSAEILLELDTF